MAVRKFPACPVKGRRLLCIKQRSARNQVGGYFFLHGLLNLNGLLFETGSKFIDGRK